MEEIAVQIVIWSVGVMALIGTGHILLGLWSAIKHNNGEK